MKFIEFEQFCRRNKLKVFTLSDLKILFNQYSPDYLRLKISRWKKRGYLNTLKRGLYILGEARLDEFEIASKLITPSYISLETALSHYSIIPDVSAEVSLMTTKNTRTFRINGMVYQFHHIKQNLFSDFVHLRKEIFIASPEKAILDFLYFKKPDSDHAFFERINLETVTRLDLKKMQKMARNFPVSAQKRFNQFKNVIHR